MENNDKHLQAAVTAARQRTLDWYGTMQAPGQPTGVSRISSAHDEKVWPGILLPGTYNAVMGRALLDGLEGMTENERAELAAWIAGHCRDDGRFYIPGMLEGQVYKKDDPAETWRYIDFHVTNYCLGALEYCAPDRVPNLAFAEPWLDPLHLKAWLADRDMRDPWQEGNNIVNLASFFLLLKKHHAVESGRVDTALCILLDWHDRLQEPATGFWGVGQLSDPVRLLHALAGSMHNYHIWYATGRPLPYQDKAVDRSLAYPAKIVSACIDVDLVDLLVHADRCIAYRHGEIESWLRQLLQVLLDFQGNDGGFADETSGTRRQDGWVSGYQEPQGLSNTFATWFRWIAIAMISDFLWPDWRIWHFRKMIGIGYRMEKK